MGVFVPFKKGGVLLIINSVAGFNLSDRLVRAKAELLD